MEPLPAVAARYKVDYYKARALIIRGVVAGALVNGRWLCDGRSLSEWKTADTASLRAKLAQDSGEPAPAYGVGPSVPGPVDQTRSNP